MDVPYTALTLLVWGLRTLKTVFQSVSDCLSECLDLTTRTRTYCKHSRPMLYIIIWKSSTPWHLTLLSIIAWPDNPAVPSSKHLQNTLHNYPNNQFINFITDTLPRRTYWVKISLTFPSIQTGFGIFSNTSLCFMSFSRIFHLYPVDNEADVGESQSSQRQKKQKLTFRMQNMFSQMCAAERGLSPEREET